MRSTLRSLSHKNFSIISSRKMVSSFAAAPYRHHVTAFDPAVDAKSDGNPALDKIREALPDLKMYTRSSPRYEGLRGVYNKLVTAKPLAMCRPTSVAQVQAIVKMVSGLGLPLGIRCGGHDVFGRGCVADSITIDMRELDTQELADDKKTVTLGGGITSKNLVGFLGSHDLCTSNGFAGEAGWTSWASWGGYGPLADYVGLGVDNIVGAKIVTANGDIVQANGELLWALRGAGGNFGIITETQVQVYPMSKIKAGFIVYPWEETAQVLRGLQRILDAGCPNKLCLQMGFTKGEWGLGMAITFIWPDAETIGPGSEGEEWLQKVKQLGTVVVDTIEETTFPAFQHDVSRGITDPVNVASRHISIAKFTDATVSKLVEVCEAMPAETDCTISGSILHGKAAEPNAASSFGTRKPHIMLHINALVEDPAHEHIATAWVDRVVEAVGETGESIGPTYVSFMESGKNPEACYGTSWNRLKAVKKEIDPKNVFRYLHGRVPVE